LNAYFRTCIIIFSICCHLFGAIVPANAQANQISHKFSQADIAPICTGNGVKWVSLTEFYQSGVITFVEPPNDNHTPEHQQLVKCSLCTLFGNVDCDQYVTYSDFFSAIKSKCTTYSKVLASKPYVISLTHYARGPPEFLS